MNNNAEQFDRSERRKILVEIFEELPSGADKEAMLGRANEILKEIENREEYEGSIAYLYTSQALEILTHAQFDTKEFSPVAGFHNNKLRDYVLYLLERARDNYTNETAEEHAGIFESVKEFMDQSSRGITEDILSGNAKIKFLDDSTVVKEFGGRSWDGHSYSYSIETTHPTDPDKKWTTELIVWWPAVTTKDEKSAFKPEMQIYINTSKGEELYTRDKGLRDAIYREIRRQNP